MCIRDRNNVEPDGFDQVEYKDADKRAVIDVIPLYDSYSSSEKKELSIKTFGLWIEGRTLYHQGWTMGDTLPLKQLVVPDGLKGVVL